MPHSSGGGSHSGGSHSSSHRSSSHSHSSGGGSHRGGSHSGSYRSTGHYQNVGARRSKTYFPGSYKYVYYRHKKPVYYYSSSAHEGENKFRPFTFVILLCYLPIFIVSLMMFGLAVDIPQKITADYDNRIVIEDTAGILESTKLEPALESFRDQTGIAPAVWTVYNEYWEDNYDSLEDYAYDLYVNQFDDENHWLIVYSEPEEPKEDFSDWYMEGMQGFPPVDTTSITDGFNDWYWEGMQGDNTDGIIRASVLSEFNSAMQKNLTARTKLSVGDAIAQAFADTEGSFMKVRINSHILITSAVVLAFVVLHAMLMLGLTPEAIRRRKSTLVPNEEEERRYYDAMRKNAANTNEPEEKEEMCEYCHGIYIRGTVTKCPHCGAPLKAQNGEGHS